MSKKSILQPQYVKNFKCIGSACEDSCCIGWTIEVDKKTYKKYKELKHSILTPLIKRYITRNRSNYQGEHNYAKIKLKGISCPFLNEKKLCCIQLEKGHLYLSNTCNTYPRMINDVNGVLEKTLTMSCPEAARIALLNENVMEFDKDYEYINNSYVLYKKLNIDDINEISKGGKYFWDIRVFSISLLQNRKYELWERLIILGMFTNEIQEEIKNNNFNNILNIILKYSQYIKEDIFKEQLKKISKEETIQMKLLKEIADKRHLFKITNQKYIDLFLEFLKGIDYNGDKNIKEIAKKYKEAHDKYYILFMKEHEYILENYCVNYLFKSTFPITEGKEIFDGYMMLVIHYSLIKMHLIGIAAKRKGLTIELVIELIQSFAKTIEHNKIYLNYIEQLIKDNNFNNMVYMTILLKN
ncbi:flagellin lysine-N-methylase [Clostridium sp. CTA-5]